MCSLLSLRRIYDVYFEKTTVFKAGYCLNTWAWNNGIGLWSFFLDFWDRSNNKEGQLGASVFRCQRWNSWIYERWTTAKPLANCVFINQESSSKTIRYRSSSNHKQCRLGISERYFTTSLVPYRKPKFLDSGGSIVAKPKGFVAVESNSRVLLGFFCWGFSSNFSRERTVERVTWPLTKKATGCSEVLFWNARLWHHRVIPDGFPTG